MLLGSGLIELVVWRTLELSPRASLLFVFNDEYFRLLLKLNPVSSPFSVSKNRIFSVTWTDLLTMVSTKQSKGYDKTLNAFRFCNKQKTIQYLFNSTMIQYQFTKSIKVKQSHTNTLKATFWKYTDKQKLSIFMLCTNLQSRFDSWH